MRIKRGIRVDNFYDNHTLTDRDSMEQQRVSLDQVKHYLREQLSSS
jgi:glycyl-tRNA synthetase (class II)